MKRDITKHLENVKAIIDRTVTNEVLENIHYACKKDGNG